MEEVNNLNNIIKKSIQKLQSKCSSNSKAEEPGSRNDEDQGTKRDFKELYRERRI